MKRSIWKLPYIHTVFFKKRFFFKNFFNLKIRNSVIPSSFCDKRIRIYNGIWYLSKDIALNVVGFKVGEFSFTKRSDTQIHLKFKSKKKSKKK
jgi:ribosomal protein S19